MPSQTRDLEAAICADLADAPLTLGEIRARFGDIDDPRWVMVALVHLRSDNVIRYVGCDADHNHEAHRLGIRRPDQLPDGAGRRGLRVAAVRAHQLRRGGSMNDHLTTTTTPRGFDHLPPIKSYGGYVTVYESSAAEGPHIWLRTVETLHGQPETDATIHLTAENAWRLSEQLQKLVRDHYQGDATPEWAR
jgi:hypothetical protein